MQTTLSPLARIFILILPTDPSSLLLNFLLLFSKILILIWWIISPRRAANVEILWRRWLCGFLSNNNDEKISSQSIYYTEKAQTTAGRAANIFQHSSLNHKHWLNCGNYVIWKLNFYCANDVEYSMLCHLSAYSLNISTTCVVSHSST